MITYASPFWRTLRHALVHAGWQVADLADELYHEGAAMTVERLSGKAVRVLYDDAARRGPVVSSRIVCPERAALDVAEQIHRIVSGTRIDRGEEIAAQPPPMQD